MGNAALTKRMLNFFGRQIALCETMLASHETMLEDLEGDRLEELAEEQRVHAREATALEREHQILRKEWDAATDLEESEREEVRVQSDRAAELARELRKRNDEAVAHIGKRMDALKQESRKMRRGLESMKKFRPGLQERPGFLDKKT